MKPFKLLGPGDINRAMMPAMKPIPMIQTMFDKTISLIACGVGVIRSSAADAADILNLPLKLFTEREYAS
jgi:hypothetical protein